MIQLDFFTTTEDQILAENRFLKAEMKQVAEKASKTHISADKVRKKLFVENGELKKRVSSLESRLEILEKFICTQ